MDIPAADLHPIRDLYNRGLYRQALAAGEPFGALRQWRGPAGRLLAGRLLIQLGSPKAGHQLHVLAFRESPAYPEAVYYHARYRLEQFGPLSCWLFSRKHPDWADAPPELRGDWAMVRALACARLRDFDRAEKLMAEADGFAGGRPWLAVEKASILEAMDKPAEALESARRSLEIQPWFRPGVQAVAHLLLKAGEDAEAERLLTGAAEQIESGVILAQLATVQYDRGDLAAVRASLDRYAELSPLMDAEVAKWLAARRADVAYRAGDTADAERFAREVHEPFYDRFAERLAGPPPGAPVKLPVDLRTGNDDPPGVHDLLADYWGETAPDADPDAAPALDGAPDVTERKRFADAGWAAREFTLTAAAAEALLGRAVPFLVTLVEAGFGQARLAVGFDPVRQSVLLADGVDRRPTEAPLTALLERFKASGPRCLVTVPPGAADRLDGVDLPDAAEYDALYAVQVPLRALDFPAALAKLEEMRAAFPGTRLTRLGGVAYARATGHPVLLLDAVTELRRDFPHDNSLVLAEASALRDLGRVTERRDLLAAEGAGLGAEPLLAQSLAQVLLPDPAARDEAARLLRRSVRVRAHAAPGYYLLATLRWEQQRFDEAVDLYRFACCLDDREDQFSDAFAKAARTAGRGGEAVRLFQQRSARDPRPYPPAVKALVQVLDDRGDTEFARAALDKAVEKARATRPEGDDPDGVAAELLLARAEVRAARGDVAGAKDDLLAAKPDSPPGAYLRAAVRVGRLIPEYAAAAADAKALYKLDPANPDSLRLYAAGMGETEGREAARRALAGAAQRVPLHYGIAKLRAEFVYADQDDAALRVTRELLNLCPHDAWAFRQLAMLHADRKEHDAALTALAESAQTEPAHPSYYAVLAHAHRRADRLEDALTALRDSVARYPDHELAVFELVQLSPGETEKRDALEFIAEHLRASAHTGDGLLAYFSQATDLVDEPEQLEDLLAECQQFLDERPDLWQAWSVVGQLLVNSHRADEAAALAEDATERFPLVARVWIDLAMACRAADRPEDRLAALEKAVQATPGWVPPARELADALIDAERTDDGLAVLHRLVTRSPGDPVAHWLLAERLWQADKGREAFDRAKLAVKLDLGVDPRAETAWSAVLAWSDRVDAPDEPLELARELTVDRAGDPRAWLRYARTISDPTQAEELLTALDTAIRLDPRNVEAYDLKAERLAALGRHDDALRAARPDALMNDLPLVLQGRAAWVEARRGNYGAAIPTMQALVAVDPDYIWGWQQLAEWYNDTGRSESYLESAGEFLRLRPEHPMPLTMRGEARLQTGDRAGGKEDLREALRIHPSYSPAAVILFDACLADGETREARAALAVLQEHLSGPEVLVKQVQFAARTDDDPGATRAFAELCRLPGEQPAMFLQLALNEMTGADLADDAADALRGAWQDPAEDDGSDDDGPGFNPWAPLFWLDTPAGVDADDDSKIAAVDAAVAAYPTFAPALDRRAEQLAEAGRFADARAACAVPGKPTPVALRGRAAWVEAQAGDRAKAVELMLRVVADEPDYSWGWRQLTLWYDLMDRPKDCAAAADNLVRLNSADPVAHVIRGEARLTLGDTRGARADFERAFDLDPDFPAAGLQLAGAQLATDDLTGAEKTLSALAERSPGPLVTARQVRLAARQGELAAARERLGELVADDSAARGLLQEALEDFAGAGWGAEADEELARAVRRGDVSPAAAALWADRRAAAGKAAEVADGLADLAEKSPDAGREAVVHYADTLARGNDPAGAAATIHRFAELLRGDDESWARAGAVLVTAKRYDHAAAWLADHADRDDVEPWMLRPLLAAHLALGRDADAEAVARAALELDPDDPPAVFPAWLAVFAAARGETDAADEHLDAVEPVGESDAVRLVLAMAGALVTVQREAAADKPRAFATAKADLHAAAGACAPKDVPPGAARWYAKVVARLAADAGTWPARLWALGQKLRPWVRG